MPVRIYDLARKIGVESKAVIAKAKELGIAGAKVPSSSLDKITAEYLEQQFAAPEPDLPKPEPPAAPEPIVIVSAPPEEEANHSAEVASGAATPSAESGVASHPAVDSSDGEGTTHVSISTSEAPPAEQDEVRVDGPEGTADATADTTPTDAAATSDAAAPGTVQSAGADETRTETTPENESQPESIVSPPKEEAPAEPAGPKVGDKVGFIQLPPKPVPRSERGAKQPVRARSDSPAARGRESRFQSRTGPTGRGGRNATGPGATREQPGQPAGGKFVPPADGELISLKPPIVVRDLAGKLNRKPFQLIADLMELNVFANVNQAIDEVTAQKLCAKYGFRFEVEKRERGAGVVYVPKKVALDVEDKIEDLKPRAPVVTIMGHVDHGKTTLLDVIRKSDVVGGEAGGITQHIGAYTINIPHPERPKELMQITFLDTPGHAAFSAMRARGANVTDIVVLVIAANDGVMPQTLEALSHAQAAKVPIIVAVNKCDHPNANPMKARQQLQDRGIVCEEWGGETIFVDVSAITKQGVDKLLEMILLQAEIMEYKANPNRRAKGNVIESGLEPGGPTATVLVRKGSLHVGDAVICGSFWGKVRALINEEGKRIREAGPSVAAKLLGLNGVPEAGLEFSAVENEKSARSLAEERAEESRRQDSERRPKATLESLFDNISPNAAKELRVVIKADTQGSVEAIVDALKKIDSDKVTLEVIHHAVGTITESDVLLASASNAIILGFHTRIDNGVSDAAKREGVQIKLYAIIYELIDQVKEAMAGLLDPLTKEVTVGAAEVRKVFELSKGGNVAGCQVSNGRIVKGKMRVTRRGELIYEGLSSSLRRFQDEVNEVRSGLECGIRLDGFDDFREGDMIECYTLEKVAQKL